MELADDVLKSAIDYLRMTGELSSNKFIIIFRVVNCCVFVLNMVLLLANLPNAKGYMYIKIVESLGTIAHVMGPDNVTEFVKKKKMSTASNIVGVKPFDGNGFGNFEFRVKMLLENNEVLKVISEDPPSADNLVETWNKKDLKARNRREFGPPWSAEGKTTSKPTKTTSNPPRITLKQPNITSKTPKTTSKSPKTTSTPPITPSKPPKPTSKPPQTIISPKGYIVDIVLYIYWGVSCSADARDQKVSRRKLLTKGSGAGKAEVVRLGTESC
ncbi:hypothetical protein QE152_g35871 [Popillia japonica]|uniref:Uncharacterized protein n=1 Tax=Popillia japonica TaxID=7064 RepID=A0AAW1IEW9_POPJA